VVTVASSAWGGSRSPQTPFGLREPHDEGGDRQRSPLTVPHTGRITNPLADLNSRDKRRSLPSDHGICRWRRRRIWNESVTLAKSKHRFDRVRRDRREAGDQGPMGLWADLRGHGPIDHARFFVMHMTGGRMAPPLARGKWLYVPCTPELRNANRGRSRPLRA
jgi:hypothetical protein